MNILHAVSNKHIAHPLNGLWAMCLLDTASHVYPKTIFVLYWINFTKFQFMEVAKKVGFKLQKWFDKGTHYSANSCGSLRNILFSSSNALVL